MPRLITALANPFASTKEAPKEIVYIPEGENHIYPQSHPDGILVRLLPEKGEAVAAAFQADLTKLQGNNVKPRLDFKHDASGPTSGFPTGFRYQPGKGLMCEVDWSGAGKSAIEGRDFAYFSPRFDLDDDGVPMGLPDRGPLGALVNEPAFREIERIAAAEADEHSKIKASTTMPNLILAELGIAESHTTAESDAVKKIKEISAEAAKVPGLIKERDDLKTQVEASDKAAKEAAEKRADDLVSAAVADGRIAAKDDETQKGFRERISAGDSFAEKMLIALPKQHEGLEKPIVVAGGAEKTKPGEEKFKDLKGGDLLEAALAEEVKKA